MEPLPIIFFKKTTAGVRGGSSPSAGVWGQSPQDFDRGSERLHRLTPLLLRRAVPAMSAPKIWASMGWACLSLSISLWCVLFPGQSDAEEKKIPYEVAFVGLEHATRATLEPLLRSVSQCEQKRESPPTSRFVLMRRVKKDQSNLLKALHSRGYFAATVSDTIQFTRPDKPTALVTFQVAQGPLYHLGEITIQRASHADADADADPPHTALHLPTPETVALIPGEPAAARKLFEAETALLETIKEQGFPFAKRAKNRFQLDHDKQTLDAALFVETGHHVSLGPATLEGAGTIDQAYLMARIPWEPGDPYHPERLEEARRALLATGLFSIVRLHIDPTPHASGHHPVVINLVQRKQRSISSGLGYGTGTGAKVAVRWEHRNLLGSGEKLEIEAHAATERLQLKSSFGKAGFLRMDQKLLLSADLDREESRAFHKEAFGLKAGLARPMDDHLTLSFGLGYKVENIEDKNTRNTASFGLFSTPVQLTWDQRDDLLDPTLGWYLNMTGAGIVDTLGTGVWFGKFTSHYRHYYKLWENPRLILAGRLGLGSILGPSHEEIPADERFFVGGGGSLRGYGFQMATNMGQNEQPIGGRALLEFSSEVRLQLTDTVGLALFLDGGRTYEESMPTFHEALFFGPGGGIRYQTPVGPIRLDVGVPWRRRSVDSAYQVYMSIGQAF